MDPKDNTAEELRLALSQIEVLTTLSINCEAKKSSMCPIPENYPSIDHLPCPVNKTPNEGSPKKSEVYLPQGYELARQFKTLSVIDETSEEEHPGHTEEVTALCVRDSDETLNMQLPPVTNIFYPYFTRLYTEYLSRLRTYNMELFSTLTEKTKKTNPCDYRRCTLLFVLLHRHCLNWKGLKFDFERFHNVYTKQLTRYYESRRGEFKESSSDPSRKEALYDILVECLTVVRHENPLLKKQKLKMKKSLDKSF